MRAAASLVLAFATVTGVHAPSADAAPADPLLAQKIVFVRGTTLYTSDARGAARSEQTLATLPPGAPTVRALRIDAAGKALLADLGGAWWYLPLDGKTSSLTRLPCGDGPAQLAADATCVVCRSAQTPTQAMIVRLADGKLFSLPKIPVAGTRLVGAVPDRRLVWADAGGVWSAPPGKLANRVQVAKAPPLRSFLPSPDGTRALGVYADFVYEGKQQKPAELLMSFLLDGTAARRKSMRTGVPIEWSHDGTWVLVQDGASACIVRAAGGQYKCWKGYTAVGIAADGSYALVLGDRDRDDKKARKSGKSSKQPKGDGDKGDGPKDRGEESASDEQPDGARGEMDDVAVPLPTGALALYRTKLEGPYSEKPALVMATVDGAAAVIPTRP